MDIRIVDVSFSAHPRVLPYSARRTAHLVTGLALTVYVTSQAS